MSKTHLNWGFVESIEFSFFSEMTNVVIRFLDATPTAELEPITENYVQKDEVDMGMTYDELSIFGTLRKVARCGPFSMFTKLVGKWGAVLSPQEVLLTFKVEIDAC
jgi:NH3-dependent NAD+ synthetase